jgi:hypothetical protein
VIVRDPLAESVQVAGLELVILESMPVQVNAVIAGNFTLACTIIQDVAVRREGDTFTIELEPAKDPETPCSEERVPFTTTVPLDVEGLPAGTYIVIAGDDRDRFRLDVDNVLPTPPPLPSPSATPDQPNPTPSPTSLPPNPVPVTVTPIPGDAGVNVPVNGLFTRTTIHLVALGDNGAGGPLVGCGDSVIPVIVDIEPTAGVMTAAFSRLLSLKEQFYGESGLYNALYQSSLTLDGINILNRVATVSLSGQLMLGGTCDAPRVQAQLEQTALQYTTVDAVNILLNGAPLADALSQQ